MVKFGIMPMVERQVDAGLAPRWEINSQPFKIAYPKTKNDACWRGYEKEKLHELLHYQRFPAFWNGDVFCTTHVRHRFPKVSLGRM